MEAAGQLDLVKKYLEAYNSLDVEGLMELIHPKIRFINISGGETTAEVSGTEEFRVLARQSAGLFKTRKQTLLDFKAGKDKAVIKVAFEGVPSSDIPGGPRAGGKAGS